MPTEQRDYAVPCKACGRPTVRLNKYCAPCDDNLREMVDVQQHRQAMKDTARGIN